MLKNIVEYPKNILKSLSYSAQDEIKTTNEFSANFVERNKDLFKESLKAIKDYKGSYNKIKDIIKGSKVYEAGYQGLKGIKEDIATGNFYNKKRISEFEVKYGGEALNFDMNFDDFDFSDDFDEEDEEPSITDGDRALKKAIDSSGMATASTISNAVFASSKFNTSVLASSFNALYKQNDVLLGGIKSSVDLMSSTTTQNLIGVKEVLTTHANNFKSYSENHLNMLKQTNAILDEMVKMQRELYRDKVREEEENRRSRRVRYDDIVSGGAPDLKAYGKNILRNINAKAEELGLGMLLGDTMGEGTNILAQFVASPLQFIPNAIIKSIIPATLTASAKEFDKSLSGVFSTLIARLNNATNDMDSNPLAKALGSIFGINVDSKTSIDVSRYNKGPMPFDGITRKAIVEVIPGYLSRIESAMTQTSEKLFDFKRGSWTDRASIEKNWKDENKRSINSAFSDIRDRMDPYLKSIARSDKDTQDRMEKELDALFAHLYEKNGVYRFKRGSNAMSDIDGVSSETYRIFSQLFDHLKYSDRLGMAGDVLDQKESRARTVRDYEVDGTSLYANHFNNSNSISHVKTYDNNKENGLKANKTFYKNPIGIFAEDKDGRNIFSYLRDMVSDISYIRKNGVGSDTEGQRINNFKDLENVALHHTNPLSPTVINPPLPIISSNVPVIGNSGKGAMPKFEPKNFTSDKKVIAQQRVLENKDYDEKRFQDDIIRRNKNKEGSVVQLSDDFYDTDSGEENKDYNAVANQFDKVKINQDWKKRQELEDAQNNSIASKILKLSSSDRKQIEENRDTLKTDKKQNVSILDELLAAPTVVDKIKVFRAGLEDIAKMPMTALEHIITTADKRLFKFVYGAHTDERDEEGKPINGIIDLTIFKLKSSFKEFNDKIDMDIIMPLKEKLGIGTAKDMANKALGLFGITTDDVKKTITDFLSPLKDNISDVFGGAADYIHDSLGTVFGPIYEKFTGKKFVTAQEKRVNKINNVFEDLTKVIDSDEYKATYKNKAVEKIVERLKAEGNYKDEAYKDKLTTQRLEDVSSLIGEMGSSVSPSDLPKLREALAKDAHIAAENIYSKEKKEQEQEIETKSTEDADYQARYDLLKSVFAGTKHRDIGALESATKLKYSEYQKFVEKEKAEKQKEEKEREKEFQQRLLDLANRNNKKEENKTEEKSKEESPKFADTNSTQNVQGFFKGTKYVEKGGLAAISPGELIIPAELNPFNPNRDKVDKNHEQIFESKVKKDFTDKFSSFIEERSKGTPSESKFNKTTFFDDIKSSIKEFGTNTAEALGLIKDGDKEKLSTAVKNGMAKFAEIGPYATATGLLGGGVGLLTGVIGGPLLGAAIGAGVGVVRKSETAMKFLFGDKIANEDGSESRSGGLVNKEIYDAVTKYVPSMAQHGIAGALAGLFTPFGPLGGILIGSAIGYARKNERLNNMLFGDEDGLLNKDIRTKISKTFPSMAVGAVSTMLLGPFGLFGNAILGSGIGLLSTTDEFKDAVFGKKDKDGKRTGGLVGSLKKNVINPLADFGKSFSNKLLDFIQTDMIDPLKSAIKPITTEMAHVGKIIVSIVPNAMNYVFEKAWHVPLEDFAKEKVITPLGGFFKKTLGLITKPIKAVVSAPFKLIGSIGDMYRANQIMSGRDTYDTARERLEHRDSHKVRYGLAKYAKFLPGVTGILPGLFTKDRFLEDDKLMADMDIEQATKARDIFLSISKNGRKSLNKEITESTKEVGTLVNEKFKNNFIGGERSKILKAIEKGEYNKAVDLVGKLKTRDGTRLSEEDRKEFTNILLDASKKRQELINRRDTIKEVTPEMKKELAKLGFTNVTDKNAMKYYRLLDTEVKDREKNKALDDKGSESAESMMKDAAKEQTDRVINSLDKIREILVHIHDGTPIPEDTKIGRKVNKRIDKKNNDLESKLDRARERDKTIGENYNQTTVNRLESLSKFYSIEDIKKILSYNSSLTEEDLGKMKDFTKTKDLLKMLNSEEGKGILNNLANNPLANDNGMYNILLHAGKKGHQFKRFTDLDKITKKEDINRINKLSKYTTVPPESIKKILSMSEDEFGKVLELSKAGIDLYRKDSENKENNIFDETLLNQIGKLHGRTDYLDRNENSVIGKVTRPIRTIQKKLGKTHVVKTDIDYVKEFHDAGLLGDGVITPLQISRMSKREKEYALANPEEFLSRLKGESNPDFKPHKSIFSKVKDFGKAVRRSFDGSIIKGKDEIDAEREQDTESRKRNSMYDTITNIGEHIKEIFHIQKEEQEDREGEGKKKGFFSKLFSSIKGFTSEGGWFGKIFKTTGKVLLGTAALGSLPLIKDFFERKLWPWLSTDKPGKPSFVTRMHSLWETNIKPFFDVYVATPVKNMYNWITTELPNNIKHGAVLVGDWFSGTGEFQGRGFPAVNEKYIAPAIGWVMETVGQKIIPTAAYAITRALPGVVKGIVVGLKDIFAVDMPKLFGREVPRTSNTTSSEVSDAVDIICNDFDIMMKQITGNRIFDDQYKPSGAKNVQLELPTTTNKVIIPDSNIDSKLQNTESKSTIINNTTNPPLPTHNYYKEDLSGEDFYHRNAEERKAIYLDNANNPRLKEAYNEFLTLESEEKKKRNRKDTRKLFAIDGKETFAESLAKGGIRNFVQTALTGKKSGFIHALTSDRVKSLLQKSTKPLPTLVKGGANLIGKTVGVAVKGVDKLGDLGEFVNDKVVNKASGKISQKLGEKAVNSSINKAILNKTDDFLAKKAAKTITTVTGVTGEAAFNAAKSQVAGQAAEKAGGSAVKAIINLVKETLENFFGNSKLIQTIAKHVVKEGTSEAAEGAVKTALKKGANAIMSKFGQGAKKLGAKAATFLGLNSNPITGSIMLVTDFIGGLMNAGNTFGITSGAISMGERIIAGLIRVVNNKLTLGIVPEDAIVNIFINFIAPLFHIDVEELTKKREEAYNEVAKYNELHGTDFTVQDYNNRDKITTKLKNWFTGKKTDEWGKVVEEKGNIFHQAKEGIKTGFSNMSKGLKEGFVKARDAVKENFSYTAKAIGDGLLSAGKSIKDGISNAINGAKNLFADFVGKIGWDMDADTKLIEDASKGDVGLLDYFKQTVSNLTTIRDKDKNPIGTFASTMYRVINMPIIIVRRLFSKLSGAIDWFKDKWEDVTGFIDKNTEKRKTEFSTGAGKGKSLYGMANHLDQRSYSNISFNKPGDSIKQTIGDSGCGPVAASTVVNQYSKSLDPISAANYAIKGGFKETNGGTKPQYFNSVLSKYNIDAKQTTSNIDVKSTLRSGKPVVFMGKDPSGSGKTPYGQYHHYVVGTGMDSKGNVIIEDPDSRTGKQKYNFDNVMKMTNTKIITSSGGMGTGFRNTGTRLGLFNSSNLHRIYGRKKFAKIPPPKYGTSDGMDDFAFQDLGTFTPLSKEDILDYLKHFGSPKHFVDLIPAFIKVSRKYKLDPRWLIAHSGIETGWGSSSICIDKGNYFGITAFDATPYESSTNFTVDASGKPRTREEMLDANVKWIKEHYYDKGFLCLYDFIHKVKGHAYSTNGDYWIRYLIGTARHFVKSKAKDVRYIQIDYDPVIVNPAEDISPQAIYEQVNALKSDPTIKFDETPSIDRNKTSTSSSIKLDNIQKGITDVGNTFVSKYAPSTTKANNIQKGITNVGNILSSRTESNMTVTENNKSDDGNGNTGIMGFWEALRKLASNTVKAIFGKDIVEGLFGSTSEDSSSTDSITTNTNSAQYVSENIGPSTITTDAYKEPANTGNTSAEMPSKAITTDKNLDLISFMLKNMPNTNISCGYRGYAGHTGIDFASNNGKIGDPIYCPVDGVVQNVRTDVNYNCYGTPSYGIVVWVKDDNGYLHGFAHLSKVAAGISKGVRVKRGSLIGYLGNTGNSSGPHLHYEVRQTESYGSDIDPARYSQSQLVRTISSSNTETSGKGKFIVPQTYHPEEMEKEDEPKSRSYSAKGGTSNPDIIKVAIESIVAILTTVANNTDKISKIYDILAANLGKEVVQTSLKESGMRKDKDTSAIDHAKALSKILLGSIHGMGNQNNSYLNNLNHEEETGRILNAMYQIASQ